MTDPIITYVEAIRAASGQAKVTDDSVVMLGEDVSIYGHTSNVSGGLFQRFGKAQIMANLISELVIVAAAIDAALIGMNPIVDVQFSGFTVQAMDQSVNQAAKIHKRPGKRLG